MTTRQRVAQTLAVGAAMLGAWTGAAVVEAAELKVLSGGAVRSIVTEMAEAFRQETGNTIQFTFAPVGELRKKLSEGERADVVILSDTAIDQLMAEGVAAKGTRTDIARTGIGVAVREGAPRPDISTPEAFKQTLLAAKSLVYVDPARGATSGVHFAGVLERLGIADAVKGKTTLVPGGYAAEVVAKGEAELCVHQISEILPVKGVTLVGPLPRELQKITTYSAAVGARTDAPEAARAFTAFMARPTFKPKLAAAGLDYRE
jgi:molybdate transport system substrate-binding protein